jgi:putative flippase GtrA
MILGAIDCLLGRYPSSHERGHAYMGGLCHSMVDVGSNAAMQGGAKARICLSAEAAKPGISVQLWRLLRFASVGLLSTLLYSGLYATLKESFDPSVLVTTVIAYGCAMIASFLGHKHFTFRALGNTWTQVIRYVVVYLSGFVVAYAVMALCTDFFGLHYMMGILAVDVAVPILSFLLLLGFVFADRDGTSPAASCGVPQSWFPKSVGKISALHDGERP